METIHLPGKPALTPTATIRELETLTLPGQREGLHRAVLHYNRINGERSTHRFTAATLELAIERLEGAVAKFKRENPDHDMGVEITHEFIRIRHEVMSDDEYKLGCAQSAYFRQHAPNCGRRLGF